MLWQLHNLFHLDSSQFSSGTLWRCLFVALYHFPLHFFPSLPLTAHLPLFYLKISGLGCWNLTGFCAMMQLHISNSLMCAHTKGKHSPEFSFPFSTQTLCMGSALCGHTKRWIRQRNGEGMASLLWIWAVGKGGGRQMPESDHGITSATGLDQFVRTWADFGEQKGPISDTD